MQNIGQSAGKSFAYLLGVYLGDGCVTLNRGVPYFKVNTIDLDFAEAVRTALVDLGCKYVPIYVHSVRLSSKPNHAISIRCDDVTARLVSDTARKAVIPEYVFAWPRDLKLAFIAGLMDSEGFVAANKSNPTNRRFFMGFKSCDPWVPDFIRVLEGVGIRVGKVGVEKPRKAGYRTPMRFTIKMQSWIDAGARFNIARKQDRVEEWASVGAYERRAKSPRRLTSETTRQAAL